MAQVFNAHHVGKNKDGAIYIGRPSPWGNPLSIGKDGSREEVLKKYINWLHDNPEFVTRVRKELAGKDLICWCAPSACHGHILAKIAAGEPLPPRSQVPKDPGIREYRKEDVAAFFRVREAFGELSNMHPDFPFKVGEIDVPSSEAYYQAMRFPDLPDFQAEILSQTSPMLSKRHAYKRISEARPDWLQVNVAVMRHALRLKAASNHERIAQVMEATEGKPIVEISSRDDFWGAFDKGDVLVGRNVLGRLEMELRQEMIDWAPSEPVVVRAPNIPGALFLGQVLEDQTIEEIAPEQPSLL